MKTRCAKTRMGGKEKKFGLVYLIDFFFFKPLVGGQKNFESFRIPFVLPLWQLESFKKKRKEREKGKKSCWGRGEGGVSQNERQRLWCSCCGVDCSQMCSCKNIWRGWSHRTPARGGEEIFGVGAPWVPPGASCWVEKPRRRRRMKVPPSPLGFKDDVVGTPPDPAW